MPEAWSVKLARCHATAHIVLAFQHEDFLAGLGQIGCGHEAIVPAADGDDIVMIHRIFRFCCFCCRRTARGQGAAVPDTGAAGRQAEDGTLM